MGWVARRMEVSALEMKMPMRRMRITFVTEGWGGGEVWDSSSGGLRVVVRCEGGEMGVVGGGGDAVVSESRGVRSSSACVGAAMLLCRNLFQAVHRFFSSSLFNNKVHFPPVVKIYKSSTNI